MPNKDLKYKNACLHYSLNIIISKITNNVLCLVYVLVNIVILLKQERSM